MTLSASQKSQALSAIVANKHIAFDRVEECVALLGAENRSKVVDLLDAERLVRETEKVGNLPAIAPHRQYTDLFNDLCGFPDEYKIAMNGMSRDGFSLAVIADHYGWSVARVSALLKGNRTAYFWVGE